MDLVKKKSKKRKKSRIQRKVRMVSYSPDIKQIYSGFIKIFQKHLTLAEHQSPFTETINTFFGANYRHVYFCRATIAFQMPGMIVSPTNKVKRTVRVNDPVIIRYDIRTPELNEVDFADQGFRLTELQRNHIMEKLKIIC